MKGLNEQNYVHSFDAELAAVDAMISEAAAATDAGDYGRALKLFKRAILALKSARQLIETVGDLSGMENSIAEMDGLLESTDSGKQ